MKAIPECFDVVKRLGIFSWMCKKISPDIYFNELFNQFQNDYNNITQAMLNKKQKNDILTQWALDKFQIGIPKVDSKTTFNKYVRVGIWLKFYDFSGELTSPYLISNNITNVYKIIFNGINYFNLNYEVKLLLLTQIMSENELYLIPLLETLKNNPLTKQQWITDTSFQNKYLNNIINYIEHNYEKGLINSNDNLQKKYTSFHEYLEMTANGKSSRTLLHYLDAMTHWLIDLELYDKKSFLYDSVLKSPLYIDNMHFFNISNIQEYDNIKKQLYNEYIKDINNYDEITTDIESETENALMMLTPYYKNIMPIEPVLLLTTILFSKKSKKSPNSYDIQNNLKNKYQIMRDWSSGLGFIKLK